MQAEEKEGSELGSERGAELTRPPVWKTLSFAFLPESVFISRAKEGYGQGISAGRVRSLVMSSAAGGCLWCCTIGNASSSPASAASRVLNVSEVGPGLSRWQLWDPSSFASALLQRAGALPLRRLESCFFSPLSLLLPFTSFSVSFSYWGIIFVSCEPMSTKF